MLELYYRPMACSLASRICIAEAGLTASFTEVDLAQKKIVANGLDYREITLLGQVPVLVLEDGTRLEENAAVLQCIADRAPHARLAPSLQSEERYRLQQWLSFIGTELHKAILYPTFSTSANDGAKEFAREHAAKTMPIVVARVGQTPYLMGDSICVADAYLLWALLLMRYSGRELEPPLADFVQRMMRRPAVRGSVMIERAELNA